MRATRMIVSAIIMNLSIKSAVRIGMIFYASHIAARFVNVIFALNVFT